MTEYSANDIVRAYLQLRDRKRQIEQENKERLVQVTRAMGALETHMSRLLQDQEAENVRTESGTFYRLNKVSVSVNDGHEFRKFVEAEGAWNLVDFRANKPAVTAFVAVNQETPPGVTYTVFETVGVRAADGAHIEENNSNE